MRTLSYVAPTASHVARNSVTYLVRPTGATESGSIVEDLSMQKSVDVHGHYHHHGSDASMERFPSPMQPNVKSISPSAHLNTIDEEEVVIRDTVVEHISEDEKSTSSEEVVFEEWSEAFQCRRTDEYDQRTNELVRSTIDETSERVKGDVVKEEYREKNQRIKGHKSYDVLKEVYRRVPASTVDPSRTTIVPSHVYEEIPPARRTSSPVRPLVIATPRPWTSEDVYTTEIVYDAELARDIESSARMDANAYHRTSNFVTPPSQHADKREREHEELISEDYHIEVEQQHATSPQTRGGSLQDERGHGYATTDASRPSLDSDARARTTNRSDSDWRGRLKQLHGSASDDYSRTGGFEQHVETSTGSAIHRADRPLSGRVGELKNAFESTRPNANTKDDPSKYKISITAGLTEQRRKVFEEQRQPQQQVTKEWISNSRKPVSSLRRVTCRLCLGSFNACCVRWGNGGKICLTRSHSSILNLTGSGIMR